MSSKHKRAATWLIRFILGVIWATSCLATDDGANTGAIEPPAASGTPSAAAQTASPSGTGAQALTPPLTIFEEVTVTATRSAQELKDVPQAITVLTEDTIAHEHSTTPNQMLLAMPGVFANVTAAQGSPIIRGQDGNRVLYLWDDIPLNNGALFAGPNAFFNQVPLSAVDRMEVIRGPGAVQYGSDAVGGVVNILSPRPPFLPAVSMGGSVQGLYGSVNGERTNNASLWMSSARFNFGGGLTSQDVGEYATPDGTEGNSGFNANGGYLDAGFMIAPNQLLHATWIQNRRGDVQYYASSKVNPNGMPRTYEPYELRGLAKVDYTLAPFIAHANELRLYVYHQYYNSARDTFADSATVLDTSLVTSPQSIYGGGALDTISHHAYRIVFGADRRAEDLSSNKTLYALNQATQTTAVSVQAGSTPPGTYDVTDGFVLATAKPLARLSVSAGSRLESVHLHSYPRPQDVVVPQFFTVDSLRLDKTWNAATWSAGSVYNLHGDLSMAGNIATSFRAPTFSDALSTGGTTNIVSASATLPSPNVQPERSITYELGPRYAAKALQLSLTAYTIQLSDVITPVSAGTIAVPGFPNPVPAMQNENSNTGHVRGIEGLFSTRLWSVWTVTGNLTYTHGEDTSAQVPLRFIPPTYGTLTLQYSAPNQKWWALASENMTDRLRHHAPADQSDVSFATDPALGSPSAANPPLRPGYQIPGYAVTSLRGGYRIWKDKKRALDLTADVQNLFNVKYREAYSQQEWLAPGLGVALGGRLTF
jgi:outer membrane receptor protein involved in Fe transport